ncbi:TPA: WGR domain-containing protein [Pseudomonas aeruginosa]
MPSNLTRNYLYQVGSSNKFYTLHLIATGNAWEVTSHYGRAGSGGRHGVVERATTYSAALRSFEKACDKRIARGYILAGTASNSPAPPPPSKPAPATAAKENRRDRLALMAHIPAHALAMNPMSLLL